MADVITRFKVDLSQYDNKLKRAKSSLVGFQKSFGSLQGAVGGCIAKYASWTAAVAAAGKAVGDIVQKNREFEQSNANLAAVLGTTRSEIVDLTNDAKKLGSTTMFTASQVTELQTELAKLGFNQQEIKSATGDVLNLAAATGTDLATAAAQAGATMRGFGLDASEMDRVASVLAVSTSKSALSMEKLGIALPIVQTTAAKTGFTLEDTAAMLGKLTDNGINAASAGTQLRKIMNDASTAGTKLANALGGPVSGFDDMIDKMNKLAKSNHKHADSVALVNSKNATALDIIIDVSRAADGETSSIAKLRNELTGCGEALDGMVNEQMNTLDGSIKIMQSAWEGLMLSFSNSNGILKSVTDKLAAMISEIAKARNLANGGTSAVSEYENGADKKYAKSLINTYRGVGKSDDDIQKIVEGYRDYSQDKLDKAEELIRKFEAEAAKDAPQMASLYEELRKTFGKNAAADGNGLGWLYKYAAGRKGSVATYDLALGLLKDKNPTGTEDAESSQSDAIKTQRKRIQQELAKEELQALEDLNAGKLKSQEEYEDKVYELKRASLLKQQALYSEGTDQYIDLGTSVANLDIQQQGRVYRRGQKADAAAAKEEAKMPTFDFGSLDHLNQILKDARDHLNGLTIGTEEWADAMNDVKEAAAAVDVAEKKMGITAQKSGEQSNDAWKSAASAVGQLGGAVGQLNNNGLNVAGTIAQAIANVALGLGEALSIKNQETTSPWEWIAAAIAGTATMVGSIAAIKSATEYHADGGFAGMMQPRGTDVVPAMLTPGELVLNRAQQRNLAGQLAGTASMGEMTLRTEISGENLAIVLDNNNRRRGRSKSVR